MVHFGVTDATRKWKDVSTLTSCTFSWSWHFRQSRNREFSAIWCIEWLKRVTYVCQLELLISWLLFWKVCATRKAIQLVGITINSSSFHLGSERRGMPAYIHRPNKSKSRNERTSPYQILWKQVPLRSSIIWENETPCVVVCSASGWKTTPYIAHAMKLFRIGENESKRTDARK